MKKNMGSTDRIIRIVIALIASLLYFNGTITGTLGIVIMAFAIIFAITSFISFCPLYLPFGFSTYKVKKQQS